MLLVHEQQPPLQAEESDDKEHSTEVPSTCNKSEVYSCQICNEEFGTLAMLQSHQTIVHTEDEEFICQTCGLEFIYEDSLEKHREETCH